MKNKTAEEHLKQMDETMREELKRTMDTLGEMKPAHGEYLDRLAALYGKQRIVESDPALRVRVRHSFTGLGTRDALFYALRECAPDLGVVLVPTQHKVPGFWTLLWHTLKRKPVPREADIVVHFYVPHSVECDMSKLIDCIKANLRVGLTWRVVINGGD